MVIQTKWMPFASFSLLAEFEPAVGQEYWHCDMKRGFKRIRKKEPLVTALLAQDTTPQRIGLLAQQGVYEFHQHEQWLDRVNGVELIATLLQLNQELPAVRDKVLQILKSYHDKPVLRGKNSLKLNRGDEGIPSPIELYRNKFIFKLFAAIDCIFLEANGTLHILDLKTGKADFDPRQGYIYLLAARNLYPKQKAIASFYNMESCEWSDSITATEIQLDAIQSQLARFAQKHELEKQRYRQNSAVFAELFPPNSDPMRCQHCQFHPICAFSTCEVSA